MDLPVFLIKSEHNYTELIFLNPFSSSLILEVTYSSFLPNRFHFSAYVYNHRMSPVTSITEISVQIEQA